MEVVDATWGVEWLLQAWFTEGGHTMGHGKRVRTSGRIMLLFFKSTKDG